MELNCYTQHAVVLLQARVVMVVAQGDASQVADGAVRDVLRLT